MKVILENMEFFAFHGCLPDERSDGNRFCVNLEYEYDMSKAAESDDVGDAVDYSSVYSVVSAQMQIPSNLLENVAWRILEALKKEFPMIVSATVSVCKYNPPVGGNVEKSTVILSF